MTEEEYQFEGNLNKEKEGEKMTLKELEKLF